MIAYPLTRANRLTLARAFVDVPRVDNSIDCVLEDHMGVAYTNSLDDPRVFMIELDQFFAYVAGDLNSSVGRDFIQQIPSRMLMAGSDGWHDVIQTVLGDRAKAITRYRYSPASLSIDHLKTLADANPNTPNIQPIDVKITNMDIPYLEIGAFESPEDFVTRGLGFCMLKDDQVIGVIYASLVSNAGVEISIVVNPSHHRQGIATALACQFLITCLEHNIIPNWDAANLPSCALAEKLGYTALGEYTAYIIK